MRWKRLNSLVKTIERVDTSDLQNMYMLLVPFYHICHHSFLLSWNICWWINLPAPPIRLFSVCLWLHEFYLFSNIHWPIVYYLLVATHYHVCDEEQWSVTTPAIMKKKFIGNRGFDWLTYGIFESSYSSHLSISATDGETAIKHLEIIGFSLFPRSQKE